MKHSDWNEIDLDMFFEILDSYWEGKFNEKILEIANLGVLGYTGQYGSMFIGNQIDIDTFPEGNEVVLRELKRAKEYSLHMDTRLTYCILDYYRKRPAILPITDKNQYNEMKKSWFGEFPIVMYHLKKSGENTRWIGLKLEDRDRFIKNNQGVKKMILLRTVDKEYWKKLVEEYIKERKIADEYIGEGYPKKESIIII